MNTQHNKALTLAVRLIEEAEVMDMGRPPVETDTKRQAAAELRRLTFLKDEMVQALQVAKRFMHTACANNLDQVTLGGNLGGEPYDTWDLINYIDAVIAKGESK